MKSYNFITHGSTLINVNEVVCANLSDREVTIIFKNNNRELGIHFENNEEALNFINAICAAVGK